MTTFNRKDFEDNKCSHQEYYSQFVNVPILYLITAVIGKYNIIYNKPIDDVLVNKAAYLLGDSIKRIAVSNQSLEKFKNKSYISDEDKIGVVKAGINMILFNPTLVAKF